MAYPRSAKKAVHHNMQRETEPVKVYCRIKPCSTERCVERINNHTVRLFDPSSEAEKSQRKKPDSDHKFAYVFDEHTKQDAVFHDVAMPLLRDLLQRKNGLLFTYGITSSGKTFTMMGTAEDPGLIPRTLDVLFNSIRDAQALPCLFQSDHVNGFFVEDEMKAREDRRSREDRLRRDYLEKTNDRRGNIKAKEIESDFGSRMDRSKDILVGGVEDNCQYTVFISYIQIYNEGIYDLLQPDAVDPSNAQRLPTTLKKQVIFTDRNEVQYVSGVTEIEVCSADEALALVVRGQKVRCIASTSSNAESSRSHTILNIRLVHAPAYDGNVCRDRDAVNVNLLSLVDLAGSERAKRTKNGGKLLKEAGKINNSLMGLRLLMEKLRQNQTSKFPQALSADNYRGTKLGRMFQTFFHGKGQGAVKMVVCVNPASDEYSELVSVLLFAESTQEVQTVRQDEQSMSRDANRLERNRRLLVEAEETSKQAYRLKRKVAEEEEEEHGRHSTKRRDVEVNLTFPGFMWNDCADSRTLPALGQFLEDRIRRHKQMHASNKEQDDEFARRLKNLANQNKTLKRENVALRAHLSHRDDQFDKLRKNYQQLLEESDMNDKHRTELGSQLQDLIHSHEEERRKWQNAESIRTEEDSDNFRDENSLEDGRKKGMTSSRVRTMTQRINESSSTVTPSAPTVSTTSTLDSSSKYHLRKSTVAKSSTSKKHTIDSANRHGGQPLPHINYRYNAGRRNSRDKNTILHTSEKRVPVGTIMKPSISSRKRSISKTKLTMGDFMDAESYALEHQDADSEGNLQTCYYKADIIPTCSGGRAVVFKDVEMLTQSDPQAD